LILNGVIRKIFVTKSNDVVNDCLLFFNCAVSDAIYNKKKLRFLSKLKHSDNMLFSLVLNKTCSELSTVEQYAACHYIFSLFLTCFSLLFSVYLPHAFLNKVDYRPNESINRPHSRAEIGAR